VITVGSGHKGHRKDFAGSIGIGLPDVRIAVEADLPVIAAGIHPRRYRKALRLRELARLGHCRSPAVFHFFDSFRSSVNHCTPCPEAAPAALYIFNSASRSIRERQFPAACAHKPAQERSIGQVVRRAGNKRLPAHQQHSPTAALGQSGIYGLQFFRPRLTYDEQQGNFSRCCSHSVCGGRSQKFCQGNRTIVCAKLIQIPGHILRSIAVTVRLRRDVSKAQGHTRSVWPSGRKGLHHGQGTVKTRHCAGMHGRLQLIVHVIRIFLRHMAGDFGRFVIVVALQGDIQHAFQRVTLYGVAGKQAVSMRLCFVEQ